MFKQVTLEGWKGKDEIEIYRASDYYEVVEHRKCKETGRVREIKTLIPLQNVDTLKHILLCFKDGEDIGYREIVGRLINALQLPVGVDAFNGGKNRARYYFPLYYYPAKILEYEGWAVYFGRGKLRRLA